MLAPASARLESMHRTQVHREPWPEFSAFERDRYPAELRRAAAVQWAGRARAEHGSVHQFTALAHALSEARAPLHVLGALARLVTDEVRHAELCARMALACWPDPDDALFGWPPPRAPWPHAPHDDTQAILRWSADAVVTACCIGETLSRPMLEAIATVTTDPIVEAVAAQILRDEHLHATFGFEALGWLLGELDGVGREDLQRRLPARFAGVEQATVRGISMEALAGTEITIVPGDPNLGTLSDMQYAMIFYATCEHEVLPGLQALGLDALSAWRARPR